jgi:hypothetical protein
VLLVWLPEAVLVTNKECFCREEELGREKEEL